MEWFPEILQNSGAHVPEIVRFVIAYPAVHIRDVYIAIDSNDNNLNNEKIFNDRMRKFLYFSNFHRNRLFKLTLLYPIRRN